MRLFLLICALFCAPIVAYAQTPPFEVRTNDGATSCIPSYVMAVNNGSLSCGTVAGRPAAIVNMGTASPTLPWSEVTAGANTNALQVTGTGTLVPATGGTIEANVLKTGTFAATTLSHANVTAGMFYVGDTTAESMKILPMKQCNSVTEKLWWNQGTLDWECATDQGGVTAGQVLVSTNDTTTSFLSTKINAGNGLAETISNPSANEVLDLALDLLDTTGTGTTSSASGLEFVNGKLSLLHGCTALQSVRKNATNTGYECFTPGTGGGGGSPGSPVNSVQANLNDTGFFGSSRWTISQSTGALTGQCDINTSGDCAVQLAAEQGPVNVSGAPVNTAQVYPKQTGTTYQWCWHGKDDTGERCVSGTVQAQAENWRMGTLEADGITAKSAWEFDTGTITPLAETANAIKYASIGFAQAGTSCVQRQFAFPQNAVLGPNAVNADLQWKSKATSGDVTFTVQVACWQPGTAESAVSFIGNPTSSGARSTNGTDTLNGSSFTSIDITGCTIASFAVFRLCQTANTLTGGSDQLARAVQFTYDIPIQQ